jgi:dTDP-glucose 4,6-dehydratase
MRDRTLLLTGGAGFMGSACARAFAADGWRVRVLDALTYAGRATNLDGVGADLTVGDVCDPDVVRSMVHACDLVVHMAAETHVDRSLSDAAPFVRTNVDGTRRVLEACAAAARPLVHVSTDEVFGSAPEGRAFAEDEACFAPGNPYAATKAAAECLATAWRHSFGFAARIVRCTNNYGPRQHPEKAIPGWLARARRGEPLPLHGRGEAVRDWLHVDDFAAGVVAVAAYRGPRVHFHLAGRQPRTNREMATMLAAACGDPGILEVPDRPGQDARYALDDAATRAELGWAPRVALAEGLAELVARSGRE